MTNKQQRSLQSFRRVQGWAIAHADILQAAPAPVFTHLKSLEDVVSRIEANATKQKSQHQLSTRDAGDWTQRRLAVRDALRPVAQVARQLRGTVFGISVISTMPATNVDSEKLVTAANSMADDASIFKGTLIDHGLQPDFIETIQAATKALKASVDARGVAMTEGVGASKGIRADLTQGAKLVSFVDAGLMPLLRYDHAMLASWQNAKRITTRGVVGAIVPPAITPSVTAPSTTPPAATAVPTTTRAA